MPEFPTTPEMRSAHVAATSRGRRRPNRGDVGAGRSGRRRQVSGSALLDAVPKRSGRAHRPGHPRVVGAAGGDRVGRDLFVRVIYGIRTSLIIALFATAIAVTIGVILGMTAGYFRGWADTAIARGTDVMLSMPLLLFAIGIVSTCSRAKEGCLGGLIKPGVPVVIFVIALFSWPNIARLVRGQTLSVRERDYIQASRVLGAGNGSIMFREVLPNLVAPIIVYATLVIPTNIIFASSLSFLGLGVSERTPEWGRQIAQAAPIFEIAWWAMFFPGLFLVLTTLAFNLVGDGLRDALDPRLSTKIKQLDVRGPVAATGGAETQET